MSPKTCSCGRLTVHQAPAGIGFVCDDCKENVVVQPAPDDFTFYLLVA